MDRLDRRQMVPGRTAVLQLIAATVLLCGSVLAGYCSWRAHSSAAASTAALESVDARSVDMEHFGTSLGGGFSAYAALQRLAVCLGLGVAGGFLLIRGLGRWRRSPG